MVPYQPERIWIQKQSWDDPLTRSVVEKLPGIPVRTIRDVDELLPELNSTSDPHTTGKRTLILARHLGRFMKECPGSGAEVCCNYFVINYASNCHLECSYCVLQSYLNNPALVVFTNAEQLMAEVREKLERSPERLFRIGTGETSDSLALDGITGYSLLLVPFFASLANGVLELKTKSDQISNLQGLDHGGHTVVSWSVNSRRICGSDELKSASLDERLAAARQCQEWGYKVGLHFDPLIHYEGWESDYEQAVKEIFAAVDPNGIAWVSLGALRFTPHLREFVRKRFPKSKIPYGEFVPGHHGKLRYLRFIREEMYSRMRSWIRRSAPQAFVYLCMESRAVWEKSLGCAAPETARLSSRMDGIVQVK